MVEEAGARALPTLEDVARVAGVSRATVSRVIGNKRQVAPHLKETVEQAIAVTGYVPNRAARSLVTGRTGSVFVVVSGAGPGQQGHGPDDIFVDPFFSRVIGGFVRGLRPEDVHPILMLVESDEERTRLVSSLRQGAADGALLVSTLAADPLPQILVDFGIAAVTFARPARDVPMSFVDVANHDGATLAAKHLVARGCNRVGVLSGPLDVIAAQDRLSGFRTAMARLGRPFVPAAAGNFTVESGKETMAALLDSPAQLDSSAQLDGVFASNDLMAVGAIHELSRRGLKVPEDVAVVGFDDHAIAVMSRPALTTVRQPIEDMANRMAALLLDQINDPAQPVSSEIFEPSLVVRLSA